MFTFWQAATLIGWDTAALLLIVWIWWAVGGLSPEETRIHALKEDTSVQLTEVIACCRSCAPGGGWTGAHPSGTCHRGSKGVPDCPGIVSVALSWTLVHTVFTLRYARTYFSEPVGGIDFNEYYPPTYREFAYLAMTIGMTFQVSDTNLTNKSIRRIALAHALLSYLFGAVILALVINVVSSLLH